MDTCWSSTAYVPVPRMGPSLPLSHYKVSSSKFNANREYFEKPKSNPRFSEFFEFTFPDMQVRKKIGEGCCSEIFEGEFTLMLKKFPCPLKIRCNKYRPLSFMYESSDGIVKGGNSVFPVFFCGANSILGGLVLEDKLFAGCFAIVSTREWGDLRTLIDLRKSKLKFFKRRSRF